MIIHFPGQEGFDNPIVPVVAMLAVCLDCGSTLSPTTFACTEELEHAAQSEEPRRMSCVSDTSAKEHGSKSCPHDHACRAVSGKFADAWLVEHLPNFVECDGVKATAEKGWESR